MVDHVYVLPSISPIAHAETHLIIHAVFRGLISLAQVELHIVGVNREIGLPWDSNVMSGPDSVCRPRLLQQQGRPKSEHAGQAARVRIARIYKGLVMGDGKKSGPFVTLRLLDRVLGTEGDTDRFFVQY